MLALITIITSAALFVIAFADWLFAPPLEAMLFFVSGIACGAVWQNSRKSRTGWIP